jgi:hypothetical protein
MAKKKKKAPAKKKAGTIKAAKAKKPARKTTKAKAKKHPVKKAAKRPVARKAKKAAVKKPAKKAARKSRDVQGEGNYSASRRFRKAETDFIKRNKSRIPEMGKAAEAALEGPEGNELRAAEEAARAHAHGQENEG